MGTKCHCRLFRNQLFSLYQCCGSGMIYSGSGSSYKLLEFRIRIQPILFKHIWKLLKRFTQKEESTIFYFILQQYYSTVTQSRIRGPNIKHKIYIYLLFYVLLDQDPELQYNSGSGSWQKFWIHADPDAQHWFVLWFIPSAL